MLLQPPYSLPTSGDSFFLQCISNLCNCGTLTGAYIDKVYSRSPEPQKSLCKVFIQVPHTFLMAYSSYGTYSQLWTGKVSCLVKDIIRAENCEDSNGVSVFIIGCKIRKL